METNANTKNYESILKKEPKKIQQTSYFEQGSTLTYFIVDHAKGKKKKN